MSENTNTEIISPIETKPETATTVETTTESKSQPNPFLVFITSILKFIYKIITGLIIGFIKLDMKSKTLVVFALAFFFIGLIIGHTLGFNAGRDDAKKEVEQITGYNFNELDMLMKKIKDLENSLLRIRN